MRATSHMLGLGLASLLWVAACAGSADNGGGTSAATPTPLHGQFPVVNYTLNANTTTPPFHIGGTHWGVAYSTTAPKCGNAMGSITVFDASHPSAFLRVVDWSGCTSSSFEVPDGPGDFFLQINVQNGVVNLEADDIR